MSYRATGSPPFINVKLSIAEWNEYVTTYDFGSIPPSRVVLHHTWKPRVADWRGLASMKGMQAYYRSLGWSAAPHLYVAPDGIWLATPMREVGIHAGEGNSGYWNNGKWTYSIGLEMVGDYDHKRPSGAVWDHAKAVMGGLSKRLNISPRQLIYFHRDFSTKSCPGWAVTKEWVWGEVEAWVNNERPPAPPPPGEIGTPTPSEEELMESLLNESYKRGGGYSSEWAFHQVAVKQGMGVPLAKSTRVKVGGKEYSYQPFARDTLYNEVPHWGDVKLLSDLLGGSIPAGGLGRVLLDATYQAGGTTLHPNWAFHQYALSAKLGPPIGASKQITVDGVSYAYQPFAVDTLYNVVPKWSEIQLLSRLSQETDPAKVRLREALLKAIYQAGGATYHPEWAFHQIARTLDNGAGIGTPLSESYQVSVGGKNYALQVYALDTLYNEVPHWSEVKRLRDLTRTDRMPSFALSFSPEPVSFGVSQDATWKPPAEVSYHIIRYAPPSASRSSRDGAKVSMVIIHGDTSPPKVALERMAAIGVQGSPHYYLTLDGTIYQLVDEQDASWHSGMATLGGLWFDTNRLSIGIALQRVPLSLEDGEDLGEPVEENPHAQIDALRWLLRDLVRRYRLSPDDVVLADSLVSSVETIPGALLLTEVFEREA
jgi:hypothetical protein